MKNSMHISASGVPRRNILWTLLRTPDGQSGLFFLGFGIVTLVLSLQYPLGTPAQMGPGFFPFALGLLLTLIGGIVLLQALRAQAEALPPADLRALVVITVAVVLSGMLLLTVGLAAAVPALVVVSAFAAGRPRWLSTLVLVLALTGLAYAIFVLGLNLRIPLLRI